MAAERFLALRRAIIGDDRITAADRRSSLTELTDGWLARFYADAPEGATDGTALVAVGGYGRGELLPGSDIDVILLHDDGIDPQAIANRVFYPIWDAGLALDHAVRTPEHARELAGTDLKVVLGLIDARHIAGDEKLTADVRSAVRSDWRQQAGVRLPELAAMCRARAEKVGELAHLIEPDLVQAYGGLRDTIALRAVAASWVADQPHSTVTAEAREWLLVVRDALHRTTGRRDNRLLFHDQDDVAAGLGLVDADALLRKVAEAGRTIAYASDLTWRQVERTLQPRRSRAGGAGRVSRTIQRRPLAPGVVDHDGEAGLARGVRPHLDPALPLVAAAAAAQAGLVLAPHTVERLARECPPLPEPWPDAARDALVTLLGAGRPLVPVWEALEFAGLVCRWFPEWDGVRYRATRTPVHRHTVDRHLVETAVVAAGLTRQVTRPDLLLLAAVFHDLGKGLPGDHSETGAEVVRQLGQRVGLSAGDANLLALLVRHHLLLPEMATRRDPDDPSTMESVVRAVRDVETLDLLAALTEADATAAGPLAWSPLRARLVGELVDRVRAVLGGRSAPKPARHLPVLPVPDDGQFSVQLTDDRLGQLRVAIAAPERPGLVAEVAGVLALHRLAVRGAAVTSDGERAVLEWRVAVAFGRVPDEAMLRADLVRVQDGRLSVAEKLAARTTERRGRVIRHAKPYVAEIPEASQCATVVEVRAHDEPALLYLLTRTIADRGVSIRSAVVETLGAEAIDVFYLVGQDGLPLTDDAAHHVVSALTAALATLPTAP